MKLTCLKCSRWAYGRGDSSSGRRGRGFFRRNIRVREGRDGKGYPRKIRLGTGRFFVNARRGDGSRRRGGGLFRRNICVRERRDGKGYPRKIRLSAGRLYVGACDRLRPICERDARSGTRIGAAIGREKLSGSIGLIVKISGRPSTTMSDSQRALQQRLRKTG